ncbi:MAG: patatin-like phospholipase family protein [Patescibacteria group bacterium]
MKIGLALSGGGALGAAHIGIIEELEKNKIEIDSICGTSSGAIIGLLYTYGGLKTVNHFFDELNKVGLFNKTNLIFKRNTTIFSDVENILRQCVKTDEFYKLKIKFSCVATDLKNGNSIVLKLGDPIKAVMASAAYPGVFPIQKIGTKYLVDGGLTRNLPSGILKKQGLDFIIGSSLYGLKKFDKFDSDGNVKANPIDIAVRSLDIMQKELANYEAESCDFCFQPEVNDYRWYHFDAINDIRLTGKECAAKHIDDLSKKICSHNIIKKKKFWDRLFE